MYINRQVDSELSIWRKSRKNKPILLRGARQVGKTKTIRQLAKQFDNFVEINFEENRQVHYLFEDDLSPYKICENLSAFFNISILPGKTLLFFDEIQECIPAIRSLRFFYEKMPKLHVIAAGSLLEFALEEIPSYGVGRIRSIFMHPLSFNEFLSACGEDLLLKKKNEASQVNPLQKVLHDKLIAYLSKFLILGGMPEVISTYLKTKDLNKCRQVIDDLVFSYNDDFVKYKKRVPVLRIKEVFDSVVMQSGSKFVYSKASTHSNHKQIKEALNLLVMAGIVIPVTHTSGNGLPLGAEINSKKQKMLLFDTGIFLRILGLDYRDLLLLKNFQTINKGNVAEQFIGLELLKSKSCYQKNDLYYWHRESKSSNAEVDYLENINGNIYPIEVKAGTSGSMQSMYIFLNEKKKEKGIRFSLENFCNYDKIDVFPLYAVKNIFG